MDEIAEGANNVESCQIIAAVPHAKKLGHE